MRQTQAPAAARPRWNDRRAHALLLSVFALLYGYFFQGGGWNQNSQFDTIRALVEQHRLEISTYAANTGDIGVFEGRVYSNKAPGLAAWGAPLYVLIYTVERAAGVDINAPLVVNANAHLLTVWTSGLPAAVLLLFLYQYLCRQGATVREGLSLAGGFGAGSLLLPYSGVMMNHALAACLLFGAWYLIGAASPGRRGLLAGGLLAGLALVTEYLTAPAVGLFVAYVAWKQRSKDVLFFLIGPACLLSLLLLSNQVNFGSPLMTNYSIQSQQFTDGGLLFGMLGWPQPIRLFWLTIHPFRGLFYCCPVFLIVILSFVPPLRRTAMTAEAVVAALVVLYFLLFNLSFNGWTGGWSIGPRYLIPALPFFFSFSLPGFRRFPRVSLALIAVSAALMLSVTAVQTMIPADDSGPPPPGADPLAQSLRQLAAGRVSTSMQSMLEAAPSRSGYDAWDSYNLGELLGLPELFSLLPAFALLVGFATMVVNLDDDRR